MTQPDPRPWLVSVRLYANIDTHGETVALFHAHPSETRQTITDAAERAHLDGWTRATDSAHDHGPGWFSDHYYRDRRGQCAMVSAYRSTEAPADSYLTTRHRRAIIANAGRADERRVFLDTLTPASIISSEPAPRPPHNGWSIGPAR